MYGKWRRLAGATKLRKCLVDGRFKDRSEGSMSQPELAKRLGVSDDAVYAWTAGSRRPSPELRADLERLLGIPAIDWVSAEDRAALEKRRRRAQSRHPS